MILILIKIIKNYGEEKKLLESNNTKINNISQLNEIKENLDEKYSEIEQNLRIKILEKVMKNLWIYYSIYNNIINKYIVDKTNYENIQNIINFRNNKNKIISDINQIMNSDNYFYFYISEIYSKIYNYKNDIILQYEVDKEKNFTTIFGFYFVENNKYNCKLFYKNKELEFTKDFSTNISNNNILEIQLKGIILITNMSQMFYKCTTLINLPDFAKIDTSNVTDMSYLFYNCKSLKSLPFLPYFNTSNVILMNNMFSGCISLKNLPDISSWNTKKVTNMSSMFSNCSSLSSLPNITKWDISNVKYMTGMFHSCSLLESLPDISNWNTKNVHDINYLFCNCTKLSSLPDITKWNLLNVENITDDIFKYCNESLTIPVTTLNDITI